MQKEINPMTLWGDIKGSSPQDNNVLNVDFREVSRALGDRNFPPLTRHGAHFKVPWCSIKDNYFKGMTHTMTLNPDSYIENFDNERVMTNRLATYFQNCEYIQRAMFVHEIGKGKIHYHIMLKSKYTKDTVKSELLELFNKRRQLSHRTLVYKQIRDKAYRDQYIAYMKKEPQNVENCKYIKYI